MRRFIVPLVAGLALAAAASPSAAQGRGNGRGPKESKAAGGKGPAFCRSGEGHPVWGRSWCVDKGFGLGAGDWRRVDYGQIRFRARHRANEHVDRAGLKVVLGAAIFAKIEAHCLSIGVKEALTGNWLVPDDGPVVLQIFAGGRPVGEVWDGDRDGRVDGVVMNFHF